MDTVEGWVVALDIYGFTAELKEIGPSRMHERLITCHSRIEEDITFDVVTNEMKPDIHIYYFSDSLFMLYVLSTDTTKDELLARVITNTMEVMGIYVEHDLALRGGISFGHVSYSTRLVIGQPIIDAHHYETISPAPILWVPYAEIKDTKFFKDSYDDSDIITLKDQTPRFGIPVFPYPLGPFIELVKTKCKAYLTNGPGDAAKAWNQARIFIQTQTGERNR